MDNAGCTKVGRPLLLLTLSCWMLFITSRVSGQDLPDELAPFDRSMREFLDRHEIPGASVAVSYGGQIVLSRGYGIADRNTGQLVNTQTRFRIASVSKPITAVAILRLAQEGKLKLDDRIVDRLPERLKPSANNSADPRFAEVTLEHLLTHRGGWNRDAKDSFDPMFRSIPFARRLNKQPPASAEDVIEVMLTESLNEVPGTSYAYSNYGYCLLGRAIESATGMTYEQYVREQILQPLGIQNMQIGHSELDRRAENESKYYDTGRSRSVYQPRNDDGSPNIVASPDGAWCLEAMDAHGGWIATAEDLIRFQLGLSKLLEPEWMDKMYARPVEDSQEDVYYSCGWLNRVNSDGKVNHWHNGSLPGTTAILIQRSDGIGLAALLNTRNSPQSDQLATELDKALHRAANSVARWPGQ